MNTSKHTTSLPKALSLQSNFYRAYEGRATADWSLANFTKAYEDFSQALKFDSDGGDRTALLANRAEVLLRLGKVEEAEEDLAEARHSDEPSDKAKVFNIRGLVKIKNTIGREQRRIFATPQI